MRFILFLRGLLVLATATVLGGTLLTAPATSAPARSEGTALVARQAERRPACAPRNCWAAISFNTATGYSGWRRDVASKERAMKDALAHCKNRRENQRRKGACLWPGKRKVFVQTGCVAVAFRRRNGRIVEWAKGKGYDPITATKRARREVRGPGTIVKSRDACTYRPAS